MMRLLNRLTENAAGRDTPKAKRRLPILAAVLTLIVMVAVLLFLRSSNTRTGPQIVSQSFLQEIVATSDLSTYEAVYNGVTEVTAGDSPGGAPLLRQL